MSAIDDASDIVTELAGLLINVRCHCPSSFCVGLTGAKTTCARAKMIHLLRDLRRALRSGLNQGSGGAGKGRG